MNEFIFYAEVQPIFALAKVFDNADSTKQSKTFFLGLQKSFIKLFFSRFSFGLIGLTRCCFYLQLSIVIWIRFWALLQIVLARKTSNKLGAPLTESRLFCRWWCYALLWSRETLTWDGVYVVGKYGLCANVADVWCIFHILNDVEILPVISCHIGCLTALEYVESAIFFERVAIYGLRSSGKICDRVDGSAITIFVYCFILVIYELNGRKVKP